MRLNAAVSWAAASAVVLTISPAFAQLTPQVDPPSCADAKALKSEKRVAEAKEAHRLCNEARKANAQARQAEIAAASAPEAVACASPPAPAAKPKPAARQGAAKASAEPDVRGVRLGMTPQEVIGACCAMGWQVTQTHAGALSNGNEVIPGTTVEAPIEPAHLHQMFCTAPDGVLQTKFSYPPLVPRVIQINFEYAPGRVPSPIFFISDFRAQYGQVTAQLEPESDGQGGQHFAWEWSLPKRKNDANCLNTGQDSTRKPFEPVLPPTGTCATSLLAQSHIRGEQVTLTTFELVNVRELAEAFDQHITFLNRNHGAHLPEGSITRLLTRNPAAVARSGAEAEAPGMRAGVDALLRAQQGIFAAGDLSSAFSAALGGMATFYNSMTPEQRAAMGKAAVRINECKVHCRANVDPDTCERRCRLGP